jgi:2,3-bisphosphoglycerate-independent phosphoglycerate mutase
MRRPRRMRMREAAVELRDLVNDRSTHIVLLVIDGLGGYADARQGSELEDASTPNLDQLAAEGSSGLALPAGPGITVGSGPGHLALFGYDPLEYDLGRGLLSALGLGVHLRPGDLAARGNLATLDADGNVTDRRAGRIDDARARVIVDRLQAEVSLPDVEVTFRHVSEHRVLLVLRGEGLDPRVGDLDPQRTGVPPLAPAAAAPEAERTARLLSQLETAMRDALVGQDADTVLFRGFDTRHELPRMQDRFGLRPATVATYPMYRGVAKLVGMDQLPVVGSLGEQIGLMAAHWNDYDYLFAHEKAADSAGHDGRRNAKIAAIEAVDALVPDLVALRPDVLCITGDHAAPTQLAAHSWHPVPTLLWGEAVGRDAVTSFGERACASGMLGHLRTQDLMPLMLASAGRLEKYGA